MDRRAHGHTAEQQTQLSRNREMATYLHKMQELLEQQSTDLQVWTASYGKFNHLISEKKTNKDQIFYIQ